MSDFKAGQYVRCVDNEDEHTLAGLVGAVFKVAYARPSSEYIDVEDWRGWMGFVGYRERRFIPWEPKEGDWAMYLGTERYLVRESSALRALRGYPQESHGDPLWLPSTFCNIVPVLGRAPKLPETPQIKYYSMAVDFAKPRDFQVGDVVECLPDQEWESANNGFSIAKQYHMHGTISGMARCGAIGCADFVEEDLYFRWPVRSLKLIEGCGAVKSPEASPSMGRQIASAPLPASDPDAEAWARFRADRLGAFKRLMPPLSKRVFLPDVEADLRTDGDIRGMQERNEREARKYAGWRGE